MKFTNVFYIKLIKKSTYFYKKTMLFFYENYIK